MQEDGKHYLFVKGQKVYVSDEIYRAYVRPERKERMRRYRIWRAKRITSVELLAENGYELEDKSPTVETALIEEEECSNELANLHAAIAKLSERNRKVIQLYFYESKTQEEIAEILSISQPAVSMLIDRILLRLKKFL